MPNKKNVGQELSKLLQVTKDSLSNDLANFISEFIDVGEWGLALETIYDHLDDNVVLISKDTCSLVQNLASLMEMDTRDWQSLESQIRCD